MFSGRFEADVTDPQTEKNNNKVLQPKKAISSTKVNWS